MAIISEEPVITRLDRLDNMAVGGDERDQQVGQELLHIDAIKWDFTSTEGHPSSVDLMISISPTSLEKYCRPIDHVVMETQVKGSLVQRLDRAEERLLKLCLQLEEESEAEKKRELDDHHNIEADEKKPHKRGIKRFVKQCVKGKHWKHKSSKNTHVGTEKYSDVN